MERCRWEEWRETTVCSAWFDAGCFADHDSYMHKSVGSLVVGEPSVDARAVASAHGKFFAVDQHDSVLAVGFGAHLFYMLQVDDGGTMDAEEHVRVELLFEAGHGLAEEMRLVLGANAHVVFFGRDPANVRDGKEDD